MAEINNMVQPVIASDLRPRAAGLRLMLVPCDLSVEAGQVLVLVHNPVTGVWEARPREVSELRPGDILLARQNNPGQETGGDLTPSQGAPAP